MVRSNTPLPFMFRLKNQASGVCRKAVLSKSPTTALIAPLSFERRRKASGVLAATNVKQLWSSFVDRYEQFTDVLCGAAKNGCTRQLESEYSLLRRWFLEHYYRVAPRLRPYLEASCARTRPLPMLEHPTGLKREMDRFEAVFVPVSLHEVLEGDNGDLIESISRLSEAVYLCGASLRAQSD